jgi:hypothetical protein
MSFVAFRLSKLSSCESTRFQKGVGKIKSCHDVAMKLMVTFEVYLHGIRALMGYAVTQLVALKVGSIPDGVTGIFH